MVETMTNKDPKVGVVRGTTRVVVHNVKHIATKATDKIKKK